MERREPQRRYPILLLLPIQTTIVVFDEFVRLFGKSVPDRECKAERPICEALTARGRSGGDRRIDHPHWDRPYTRLS